MVAKAPERLPEDVDGYGTLFMCVCKTLIWITVWELGPDLLSSLYLCYASNATYTQMCVRVFLHAPQTYSMCAFIHIHTFTCQHIRSIVRTLHYILLSAIYISTKPSSNWCGIKLPPVNPTSDHSSHEEKLTLCRHYSRPWANLMECVTCFTNHWSVLRLTLVERTHPLLYTLITLGYTHNTGAIHVCVLLVCACCRSKEDQSS